jgi:hypothetical protein
MKVAINGIGIGIAPASRFQVVARNLITRLASLPGLTKVVAGRSVPAFRLEEYAPAV